MIATDTKMAVYAKLPDRFYIPTPFGNYNPDWAIVFDEREVKQIYFIAETKGSNDTRQLRESEHHKIEAARQFFKTLNAANQHSDGLKVRYDVVDSFERLRDIVAVG